MKMIKRTLYHKDKSGGLRVWSVWCEGDYVYTEYGVLDGALQISKKRCVAKNVGRSNETTPEKQAFLECEAMYQFRLARKYSATPDDAQEQLLLPMLAHKWDQKKHSTPEEGWFAQPKFDGVRCLAAWVQGDIHLLSRQGKRYTLPHIVESLKQVMPKDSIFDGELYVHGMPLQQTISLVKKLQPESTKVGYFVYDAPQVNGDDEQPFVDRYLHYMECIRGPKEFRRNVEFINPVRSRIVNTHELQVEAYLEYMLEEGYEGAMLRHPEGVYRWGYRSQDLLKVKVFQDAEFEVVGFKDGRGKMEGHIIFECKNDVNDSTFDVVPKASMAERAKMFKNGQSYIGRSYTVRFFDRSIDQIPRFPVGIAFQEDR